jgi:hypothetical protein
MLKSLNKLRAEYNVCAAECSRLCIRAASPAIDVQTFLMRVALIWNLRTVTGAVVPTCGLPGTPLFMPVGAIVVGRVCHVDAAMTAYRKGITRSGHP